MLQGPLSEPDEPSHYLDKARPVTDLLGGLREQIAMVAEASLASERKALADEAAFLRGLRNDWGNEVKVPLHAIRTRGRNGDMPEWS